MSQLKKKIDRMRRIHSLESNQLTVLIGDLARIDAELAKQRKHHDELRQMKDEGLAATTHTSVELLTQNNIWIDSVNRSLALAAEIISKQEGERADANARMMDQRARVRGLELLVDQLKIEQDADEESQQMLSADDHAMKKYARN